MKKKRYYVNDNITTAKQWIHRTNPLRLFVVRTAPGVVPDMAGA